MKTKHKVFLVDDHPLVREWLANLINQQADLEVSGEADSAPKAWQSIGESQPAIVIVDISMDGGSGLELIKNLRSTHPKVRVIVLSMHDETLYAERVLRAGARGYIMKREATKRVLLAVRTVLEGKIYLSEKISHLLAEKFVDGGKKLGSVLELLSDRELEVFQLLGRGHKTRQIAEEMKVSLSTVQAFCARIKEKLNLESLSELISEAARWDSAPHGK